MKRLRLVAAATAVLALCAATSALGGSGVGATFNLGETNTVNDTSVLTGNTPGTQLSVINQDDAHHALMAQNTGTGSGIGVYGVHQSSSGNGPGVRGDTDSTDSNSYGVFGLASSAAPTSNTAGVRGRNNSANEFGFGVWGSQEGSGMGVYGTSVFGSGVYGVHSSSSAGSNAAGVRGVNLSNGPAILGTSQNGTGVQASSTHGFGIQAGTADGIGILERSTGTGRGIVGVLGAAASCPGSYAVGGCGTTVGDGVVGTSVNGNGLFGASTNGKGIYGNSNSRGIVGTLSNTSCAGIYAVGGCGTSTGIGVYGDSTSRGVVGTLNGTPCPGTYAVGGCGSRGVWGQGTSHGTGVLGTATGTGGRGVDGESDDGPGVYGQSANSYAGDFIGDVFISGNLFVGGTCTGCAGAQLKVAGKPATMFNGNVRTNGRGFATVRVPRTFRAGPGVRYQLTVIDKAHWTARAAVWNKLAHNRFTIRTDKPHVQVSWQVTGLN